MAEQRVSLVLSVTGQQAFEKAARSVNKVERAANKIQGTGGKVSAAFRGIGAAAGGAIPGVSGLGAALTAALGPLAAVTSAAALVSKALSTAFERGAAEQKLRNFTDSTKEYEAALAVAANTASKFGMSQTEATSALADTFSRLKGLGFGLKETSEIYNGFQSIVLQSGTSAEDAAGAFLQLSQALGSGKLQGDELRAILERMPQLAQRIADSMGRSAAEVRALGQEGKITSEVIYKALSEAGGAADEFGNRLNAQQSAMKSLGAAADKTFAMIGKVFEPAVIAAAEAFTWALQQINDFAEYLGANVLPKLQAALQPVVDALKDAFTAEDLEYLVNVIQNYFIKALEGVVLAVQGISQAVAFVIRGFKQLMENPVFKVQFYLIGKLLDALGLTVPKVKEFKKEQEKVTEESAKTVENFSSMPEKIANAKEEQKKLNALYKKSTENIKKATNEIARQSQLQRTSVELGGQLAIEKLNTEKQINSVLLDQAQTRLETAKTVQQSIQAAKDIRDLTKAQAALEYEAAKIKIGTATEMARIAKEEAALRAEALKTEVAIADAKGVNVARFAENIAQAEQAVALANQQYMQTVAIGKEQLKQAQSIRDAANNAADLAYKQNLTKIATEGAANAAGQFASSMEQAASAAQQAASATAATSSALGSVAPGMQTSGSTGGRSLNFGGAMSDPDFASDWEKANAEFAKRKFMSTKIANKEFQKVIDSYERRAQRMQSDQRGNRMESARSAYSGGNSDAVLSGQSGGSASAIGVQAASIDPQVNVTTGPVMSIDGKNYVNQDDFIEGLRMASEQGARMALEQIGGNSGSRRALGVG